MKRTIVRSLSSAACAALLGAWSAGASASLVTSRFNGTVTGYEFGFLSPATVAFDDDHPVGTAVQWDLTYDDSFLGLDLSGVIGLGSKAVSGSLRVGAHAYTFTDMTFPGLSLGADFGTITGYQARVSAIGPGTSDGGDLYSMFWSFAADLSLLSSPLIGYAYTNSFSTLYGYLQAAGDYSVAPATQVPEPATLLLVVPALLMLQRMRRRVAGR